ncbi:translation initiation factor IF3-1, mitochondrial-like [Triticum urartu]|uniref:Translation initiation factor 3 N-terminal domain-containing protein n=1 Tax=Triticum urartu TaxID=4572 RepID=A0A8R7UNH6_TRIUA|nr:translation initiation factor IF3-1, mitochondrial-like [Triticum urartu]
MALRRAIGSLAVRSQASYCLRRAAASPPTLTPPPPPPPSFRRPVTVPRRSFAAPPQHVKKAVKKDDDDDAGPRLNNDITGPFLRLVTDEGHDVVPRHEALKMAARMGLDLVEVDRKSDPPVCKIMDFHKEKYIKDVKDKERLKAKSAITLRVGDIKEVRFKAKTEIKDLKVKADAITRLMDRGYRVKCMAMPAGNEAEDLGGPLSRLLGLIQDVCTVESGPHLDSKHAYVIVRHVKFATKKGGKKASKAMEDASKGTPRTATSESPPAATDSGDDTSEHGLEAEDVDKTPAYTPRESSPQKKGQDRGFRGNNRGNLDKSIGAGGNRINPGQGGPQPSQYGLGSRNGSPEMEKLKQAKANEGMTPEQTNRYASRRQQPGGVDSQGRPPQQDPRRGEHEGRYQRPPLEQPSPPPPRFNQGRPPQQDLRRNENNEDRYRRPQDNQRPPLQQAGPPPPKFSQGSRPPQQDPRGNERGSHVPPYSSQRPQFQQSNPNAEPSAGNPASTAARGVGVFSSRMPATASEPNKTADGGPASGGAGKPANTGPAKSFGIFSKPKKGSS